MPLVYRDKMKEHTHLMVELPTDTELKKVVYVGKQAPLIVIELTTDEFNKVYERI